MRLAHDQRVQIVTLREEGLSFQALADRFNVRKATIIALMQKYTRTGSVDDLPGRGRHRMSTERQDRALLRLSTRHPQMSSRGLAQEWHESANVAARPRTVRQRLFSAGRYSYIAPKKPLLTARHRATRLQWARAHSHWTAEVWGRVLFTDETPLHLVQTTQRRQFRSRRGAGRVTNIVQPRLHSGGGSIMVWGAFAVDRVLPLHRVQGTLTGQSYVALMEECVAPVWDGLQQTVLQQDNATPHKSRVAMAWFEEHDIELLEWPPMSPDLNPIENLWAHLKRNLDGNIVHGMNNLFEVASRIFRDVDPNLLRNLVESMPRRCQEVIRRRGAITDY